MAKKKKPESAAAPESSLLIDKDKDARNKALISNYIKIVFNFEGDIEIVTIASSPPNPGYIVHFLHYKREFTIRISLLDLLSFIHDAGRNDSLEMQKHL